MKVWDYEISVERNSSIGGTSRARVLEQIKKCMLCDGVVGGGKWMCWGSESDK
jgi:hypothetical protein